MNTKDMTQEQIRRAGIEALTRELGYVGMIRFLQQYDLGHGDYTKERYEWVDSLTAEEIMAGIEEYRQQAKDQETKAQAA